MEKEIIVNGRKIVYFEEGEGPPFLIIHGGGGLDPIQEFRNFQKVMAENGFKVYLPSLPGFGGSDKPGPGWKMKDYINCLSSFIDILGIEKFYLLGHSLGGKLAIRLAADFSEKVEALILYSPGIMGKKRTLFDLLRGAIFFSFLIGIRVIYFLLYPAVWILKKIRQTGERTKGLHRVFGQIRKMKNFYFKEKMARLIMRLGREVDTIILLKIKSPTLVIWGQKDFWNPLRFVVSTIRYIPGHTFKIIPEAGHNLQRDYPEELAKPINEFLFGLKGK